MAWRCDTRVRRGPDDRTMQLLLGLYQGQALEEATTEDGRSVVVHAVPGDRHTVVAVDPDALDEAVQSGWAEPDERTVLRLTWAGRKELDRWARDNARAFGLRRGEGVGCLGLR